MQVLLPAALCCSLSGVQACSLMLPRAAGPQSSAYDPLAALRAARGLRLFVAAAAVPHTVAGTAAALLVVAACALWPTPLNLVAAAVMVWRLLAWALVPPDRAGACLSPLSPVVRTGVQQAHCSFVDSSAHATC